MIAASFYDVANTMAGLALSSEGSNIATANVPSTRGINLAEAIDVYLAAKRRCWTEKTYVSRRRQLAYLCEHLTGDISLCQVTADQVRSYRDAVCRLRTNRGVSETVGFAARQTFIPEQQIESKTATLIFETAKAFFRWCKSEQGYIGLNPAEDIRIAVAKKPKGIKSRRPFNRGELETLFSAPVFTGCLSRHRRFDPGEHVIKDAKFWLPILGFYTGARLGELVQMHVRDVQLSSGVPYLHITDENAGPSGTSEAKHIKSQAGVRCVPLHPDVLTLGFADFVEARRSRGAAKRLFFEVSFGQDGQASTVFSKFFGRLLDKIGLTDPSLVFHSFRHGAEDAFRNAKQPQYVIDRILGHSDGATSSRYGQGVSLDVASAAVSAMQLPLGLPELFNELRIAAQDCSAINCTKQAAGHSRHIGKGSNQPSGSLHP